MKNTLYFSIVFILSFTFLNAQNSKTKDFSFGTASMNNAGEHIQKPISFEENGNFGFDFNTAQFVSVNADGFTGDKPVYFSVDVPEGNYQIEVVLGSSSRASNTTIKAESKRIMTTEVAVKKGKTVTKTIVVNVRKREINDSKEVSLKHRELDDLDWDDKLTLEFGGDVAVQKISISPANGVQTLFLAGDSTMTDQDLEPWTSWGQVIPQYFNTQLAVANHAFSGAALSSFKGRGRLEKIKNQLQPGDYMIIGFAHNDEKIKGEGNGAYGSYTDLLKEFITTAQEKQATPIIMTPTQRRAFNGDGTLKPTHGDFPDAIRKVAKEMNVPLIDVTKMTTKMYESWGDKTSRKAFVQYPAHTFPGQDKKLEDNTHFNGFGANEIALAIIHGIREQHLPLEKYLTKDTPTYNPKKPNHLASWTVPLSPRFEEKKPDGN